MSTTRRKVDRRPRILNKPKIRQELKKNVKELKQLYKDTEKAQKQFDRLDTILKSKREKIAALEAKQQKLLELYNTEIE